MIRIFPLALIQLFASLPPSISSPFESYDNGKARESERETESYARLDNLNES